jgi:flagellar biosynthetic protein FliO
MTTIARLLTIVAMTLPLGACAAQPAAGQAPAAAPAAPAAPAVAPSAAVAAGAAVAPAAAAAQPVAAPAQAGSDAQVQTGTAAGQPRRPAGASAGAPAVTRSAGAPGAAAPAEGTPAADSPAPALSSVPAAETTVGGGAANRVPAATGPVTMPAAPATGSLLQTLFALIVVLGVLGALAWFLKRYGPKAGGGSANLRVVGSLNLGGRERLLVVEVGSQWIVVGASPGRVNALATMPKQEGIDAGSANAALAPHTTPASSFGDWLKQTIDKRK